MIDFFNNVNHAIKFFNRAIIAVLTHILLLHFQFVCVPFAGRRRWPIAVER